MGQHHHALSLIRDNDACTLEGAARSGSVGGGAMLRSSLCRGAHVLLILALSAASGSSVGATESPPSSIRLSLGAACAAWREHVSDLLDQHRIAHEINDDAFHEVLLKFTAARDACSAGSHASGLRMYEEILLGRVQQSLMK
jgi:hypothetical protein